MQKRGRIILVVFLAFFSFAVFAASSVRAETVWLPFKGDKSATPLQYPLNVLSPDRFSFKAISSGVFVRTLVVEGKTYQQVLPPAGRILGDPGMPGMPGFTRLVFVPNGAQVHVIINEGKPRELDGYKIYPVQEQPEDNEDYQPGPFLIDEDFYDTKSDAFYPESLVSIRYDQVRGCRVALLNVHTARFNPSRAKLLYYPELDIDIRFEGGDGTYIPTEKRSIFFEDGFARIFPNYEIVRTDIQQLIGIIRLYERVDLLIVTPDAFEAQADQLAEWKRDKGLETLVVTLSDIDVLQGGTTANHIRAYIKNIFNTRSLSYVLLFGDAEFIPPHYVTPHPTSHSHTLMGTDLYYAEMDDTGYFPDVAIGRLPVNDTDEAQRVVNKIIAYEQTPPDAPDFYDRILHAAYFQDGFDDGTADRAFAQTIEEILTFFDIEGYGRLPRVYTTNSTDPRWWVDGTDIPNYLKKPDYPWDGDRNDIVDAINEGSFLVVHRDHGSIAGWSHPAFTTGDLADFHNGDLLPLILSINCQTGWFDNETDDAALDTGDAVESFAERFVTMEEGAVAAIAATRNSPSYPNNDLAKAYLDCIWNDMLPGYPTGADPEASLLEGSCRLGDALNYAKFYVATRWDSVSECQREFEIYHCLGDPTMELWTASPHPVIELSPLDRIPLEILHFKFPIIEDGVLVSLVQGGEIIGQGLSEDGQVTVFLDEPLQYSDDTSISLNKRGYVPRILPVSVMSHPSVIENVVASPNVLWPPNHKMVDVEINVEVSGTSGGMAACHILSVSSNEPEKGSGDGDASPDWEITGDLTLKLRAERSGKGDGRIYTVVVECTDESGNVSSSPVTIVVPRDQRKGGRL